MKILVANLGSTSFKYQFFNMEDESVLSRGKMERVGFPGSAISMEFREGKRIEETTDCPDHATGIRRILKHLVDSAVISSLEQIDAIGFKVVHGGSITGAVRLTGDVIRSMEKYVAAAPVHNPIYIKAVRIFQEVTPSIPLVGLFETAFHQHIPDYAYTYGIPYTWTERYGIRKYGFHGASFRYVSERAAKLAGKPLKKLRMIACHLGGSSSICAIKGGHSVDTSMGFSPQAGIINAARSGDMDAFIVPFIMERENLSPEEVRNILCKESGLLGISGISEDIRELEKAYDSNDRARLAIDVLVYDVKRYVGAYYALLNGLDILVFTGGIGEKGVNIRRRICSDMDALGIKLDADLNEKAHGERLISPPDAPVKIYVIPTNEEIVVARAAAEVIG